MTENANSRSKLHSIGAVPCQLLNGYELWLSSDQKGKEGGVSQNDLLIEAVERFLNSEGVIDRTGVTTRVKPETFHLLRQLATKDRITMAEY